MATPEGPLVIGVDSSTQSTEVLVVDAATGAIMARRQASHRMAPGHGGDPEEWRRALAEAVGRCGPAAGRAAAVAGQRHGLVTLDGAGRPARDALLWNDTRSAPQRDRLVAELGAPTAWAERIGSVPAASCTVTTWAWPRENEPASAAATRAVRLPHDSDALLRRP